MKHTSMMILLMSLMLWGCSEESKTTKKSSSSTDQLNCTTYPWMTGCPGSTTGGTTGGSNLNCTGQNYWTYPGCTGYCQYNPTNSACNGSGSGTSYNGIPSDNNWGDLYAGYTIPSGNCQSTSGSGYDLRKGTITLAGNMMYSPLNPWRQDGTDYAGYGYTHNNSSFLTNLNEAKAFLDTDTKLRVRFKVRPQPETKKSQGTWCLGRQTGVATATYGYRNLKFSVSARQVNTDGSLGDFVATQNLQAGLNSCTQTADFSAAAKSAPNGIVLVVHNVQSDQGCSYAPCTAYETVKMSSCWSMDIEASVDGTKDI